jgi:hypothetical protein
MAHFDGLVLGRKRLSHKDRLFKVFVGDFFVLIMLVRSELSIKGLARLLNQQPPKLGRGPPAAWQGPDIKKSRLPKAPYRTNSKVPQRNRKSTDLINLHDGYGHPYIT